MIGNVGFILSIAAVVTALIRIFWKKMPEIIIDSAMAGTSFLYGVYLIQRSFAIGFPALVSIHDSLVLLALCLFGIAAFLGFSGKDYPPGLVFLTGFVGFIGILLVSSPLIGAELSPPVPVLRSHWLVLHVSFAIIGEAFFTASAVCAFLYFLPTSVSIKAGAEKIAYKAVLIGYVFFTTGALVFGAIWAAYAWGSFWSWDPKETWALITWLLYSLYLHTDFSKRFSSGIRMALLLIAFAAMIFTFLGVNYFLPGLHSYS
ncbi:MAG: cytochrome c biogenesis protein CcsA [Spirochaetia bacterium]